MIICTKIFFSILLIRESKEAKSRALDNLGRLYAKMGEYTKAIDAWMEKLPLSKSVLESTWLYHEIGRCHLELKYYQDAKEFGQKSLAAAEQADDKVWQLNATVLEAQAEGKLTEFAKYHRPAMFAKSYSFISLCTHCLPIILV